MKLDVAYFYYYYKTLKFKPKLSKMQYSQMSFRWVKKVICLESSNHTCNHINKYQTKLQKSKVTTWTDILWS